MKTKHLLTVALAALMLGACSNEELVRQTDGSLFGNIPEGMVEYQFNMTGITPTHISYAETVKMEEDEMKMNDVQALIFAQTTPGTMSDGDVLVKSVAGIIHAGNKMAFQLKKNTEFGSGVTQLGFVILANKEGSNLDEIALTEGTTTYAELKSGLVSKGRAGISDNGSDGLLMIAETYDQAVPTGGASISISEAKFTRPFARFDLKNEGMKSLTITGLKVKNVMNGTRIMTGEPNGDVNEIITIAGYPAEVPEALNLPKDVIGSPKPADIKWAAGAFYAYPTEASANPALLIDGTLRTAGGDLELKDYEVPFKKKNGTSVDLAANTRYKLTIKVTETDDVVAEFDLAPVEWGEGSEENYLLDDYTVVVGVGTGLSRYGVGKMEYMGTSDQVVYHIQVVTNGAAPEAVNATLTEDAVTYSDVSAGIHNYTISVDLAVVIAGGDVTLTFPKKGEVLTIHQPAPYNFDNTLYPTVASDGNTLAWLAAITASSTPNILWAPVNVGAKSSDEPGPIYQWGRNIAWKDAATAQAAKVENQSSSLEESETTNKGKFYVSTGSLGYYWWDTTEEDFNALKARWDNTNDDGTKNPCPKGWRLPTYNEYKTLWGDTGGNLGTATEEVAGICTRTVEDVTFSLSKALVAWNGGQIVDGAFYLCNFDDVTVHGAFNKATYFISKTEITSLTGNVCNGGHIRCVKDVTIP